MKFFKPFWSMVQGDAKFMRRVNGWLTIFWMVMIPISLVMGWLQSVVFVSALSLWALVSGHLSAWQAARVEVEQDREEKEDSEEKMIKRVVKETNVKRTQSKNEKKSKKR
jgi:preprotein translocase subunit SecG